jgi:erythromycin esterase
MRPASAFCVLLLQVVSLPPPGPANPGFEQGETGQAPPGWFVPPMLRKAGYSAELRRQGCHSGSGCAVVLVPAEQPAQMFGNLMQSLEAAPYRGQRVRFRAWVRLEAVEAGDRAQLWLRVDRIGGQMGFFDNMGDRPIRSSEWRSYEITAEIDADAQSLNIGLMSLGKGRAWIDDVSFEIIQSTASAAETDAARQALQRLYDRIDAAYEKGDVDVIAALALPDATLVTPAMKVPLGAALQQVKAQLQGGTKITSRSKVIAVQLSGDDAVVSVENQGTYSSSGGQRAYINTYRDTWTRTAEGWKLKDSTPLSSRAVAPLTDRATAAKLASELKRHAVRLETVQAGSNLDDLAPFGRAVGDARIVALGEASHGTREFFQLKHRLLEYLVKEKGFTVFAIEANWPESLAVDRYIKTGEGDPRAALSGMYFWTWNTQEVFEMIEWMRAWNKVRGERPALTFTSFDMQTPDVAAERVREYLRQSAPAEVAVVETAYREVRKLKEEPGQLHSEQAKSAANAAETVVKLLDARREMLNRASSPAAWRDARQAAEIVRQACAVRATGTSPGYRDEMMARNVEWLAGQVHPTEKLVLWAHNGHVRLSEEMGIKSMGGWLRQRFGRKLYVLGFAFRQGEVRAVGMEKGRLSGGPVNHKVPPSPEGTGDAVFSAAGMPLLFLDLRAVPEASALGRWLAEPHLYHSLGAGWIKDDPDSNLQPAAISKAYDGLIFVEEGHAAQGLPFVWGQR